MGGLRLDEGSGSGEQAGRWMRLSKKKVLHVPVRASEDPSA